MSESEKDQRLQIAYNYIKNNSTLKWATAFLKELKITADHQTSFNDESTLFWTGHGLMATLNKTQTDFNMLSKSAVFNDASIAKNGLIILNHKGVLSTNKKDLPSVKRILNSLTDQASFNVVLISPASR